MSIDKKLDHTCIVCGTKYHACDNCGQVQTYTPWRTVTDTQNCFAKYMTVKSYQGGLMNKDEAKQELAALGIDEDSDLGEYTQGARNCFMEILSLVTEETEEIDTEIDETIEQNKQEDIR